MPIFNYFFRSAEAGTSQNNNVELPPREGFDISATEYNNIAEGLQIGTGRRGRTTYKEEQKMRMSKYANMFTVTKAIEHFKKEFPNLTESTVRPWVRNYREELKKKTLMHEVVISQRRGRPLYLPSELDLKLQKFLINLRKAGGSVNRHVVSVVLLGLIKSDLESYGSLLDFEATDGWLQSLQYPGQLLQDLFGRRFGPSFYATTYQFVSNMIFQMN